MRLVGSRAARLRARDRCEFRHRGALDAARARTSFIERQQSFDHQRLWADLLSSPAMCFNLFGDLAADLAARRTGRPHLVARTSPAPWRGPLRALAWTARSGLPRKPRRVGCRVRARPRRRHAGDRRRRDRVPRGNRPAAAEAEPAAAVPRDHRDVGHLRPERSSGQRDRAHPHLARPPARAVDAPASEPRVVLGPLVVVHPAGNTDFVDACSRYRDSLSTSRPSPP